MGTRSKDLATVNTPAHALYIQLNAITCRIARCLAIVSSNGTTGASPLNIMLYNNGKLHVRFQGIQTHTVRGAEHVCIAAAALPE